MGEMGTARLTEERPDFYLGTSDTDPEHWGGSPRRCFVIDRPRFGKSGRPLWRVRVDPPIPKYEEDAVSIREQMSEWILAERHPGERIEDVAPGHNVTVNVWAYNDPRAHEKTAFDSVDITHEYIGQVAATADAFPAPWDPERAWQRDFERIRRFIAAHGHSRVPKAYYDEAGTRLDAVVGDIRWHHAGRGGWSEGPYPGVDYAKDLASLEGWSWDVEDASDLEKLREGRFQAPLMRSLGLREGIDETEYIRAVTSAFQGSDRSPWPATRGLVAQQGVDVENAVVFDLIPIRLSRGYLGALVEPPMRIYSFYLGIGGDPNEPDRWEDALFLAEWHELTTDEARRRYGEKFDIARSYLKNDRV